jgi:hypothetical protein
MISNEHGIVFVNIPFTGFELLSEVILNSNPKTTFNDVIADKCIEYEYVALVKNPYHRAVALYQEGMRLRKEHNLKTQSFSEYFENILNKWDFVPSDIFETQTHYLVSEDTLMFKHEVMLEDWAQFNEVLLTCGLTPIRYYTDAHPIKKWEKHYDDVIAVELINYIFEDDFKNIGYSKL